MNQQDKWAEITAGMLQGGLGVAVVMFLALLAMLWLVFPLFVAKYLADIRHELRKLNARQGDLESKAAQDSAGAWVAVIVTCMVVALLVVGAVALFP